jgi:hypothetical protein
MQTGPGINEAELRSSISNAPDVRERGPGSRLAMMTPRLPRTHRGRAVLVFLVVLVCSGYFFPRLSNWESNSRMDLVYALGDEGTVRIDGYHLNTEDKAHFRGHYYTEKSIGPSLTGLPFYEVFRALALLPPLRRIANGSSTLGSLPSLEQVYAEHQLPKPGTPGSGHPPIYHAMALTFTTFFSIALMSSMLAAVVYLMAARLSREPRNALVVAFAFGLATPAFAYSNEFFQHQAGAFGAFVGFFLLWRVMKEGASKKYLWVVGVLFGYAAASEYVLAVILTGVVVWAVVRTRSLELLLRVAAGAAPWLVATGVYNVLAFGTPIPVGYRYSIFGIPAGSLFGLVPPSWDSVVGITFSPYRGLFLLSPFLLLAPVGFYAMMRQDRTRELAIVLSTICVLIFAYNACYWVWDGGGAIGPRFLVPMLPFLVLPIATVLDAAKRFWQWAAIWVLVLVSAAEVWIQFLAGNNFPPDTFRSPILDYALPLLGRGELRFNIGNVFGLSGFWALVPLVASVAIILIAVPRVEDVWSRRRYIPRPST